MKKWYISYCAVYNIEVHYNEDTAYKQNVTMNAGFTFQSEQMNYKIARKECEKDFLDKKIELYEDTKADLCVLGWSVEDD